MRFSFDRPPPNLTSFVLGQHVKAIHILIYIGVRDTQRLDANMELVVLSELPVQRFRKGT
jgi:hypothetical protein